MVYELENGGLRWEGLDFECVVHGLRPCRES
jgi:hypothetical protein